MPSKVAEDTATAVSEEGATAISEEGVALEEGIAQAKACMAEAQEIRQRISHVREMLGDGAIRDADRPGFERALKDLEGKVREKEAEVDALIPHSKANREVESLARKYVEAVNKVYARFGITPETFPIPKVQLEETGFTFGELRGGAKIPSLTRRGNGRALRSRSKSVTVDAGKAEAVITHEFRDGLAVEGRLDEGKKAEMDGKETTMPSTKILDTLYPAYVGGEFTGKGFHDECHSRGASRNAVDTLSQKAHIFLK